MKVAVLPFNAAEGARPALGRQFANFACDAIRGATGTEDIHPVSFLTQIEDADGPRAAYVNVADTLLDNEWLGKMFEQSDVERIVDGMLSSKEGGFELQIRIHRRGIEAPEKDETLPFSTNEAFKTLHHVVLTIAAAAELPLPKELENLMDFGTDDGEAFLKFLEGYDALQYIQQTNGRVAHEFDPQASMQGLLESCEADPEFLGSFEALVQLCRLCAQHRLGNFENVESSLRKLAELVPDDFRSYYALGEAYQAVNDAAKAADAFEKAVQLAPEEPSLYTRLGMAQFAQGMPVNAERNFRKALELEGEEKPSLDYLVMVLAQTNREHEIPGLWKEQIEHRPQDAQARAKYAISLIGAGNREGGEKAFEDALTELEDATLVKRYYAPILAEKGELDRAMDYYEDCLDAAPTDVQLLLEYAQTLKTAGREFEVPKVLRDVLACNPDANTRANVLAWLIEMEQPKRAEAVEEARKKMDEQDFASAVALVKPLRNWLADYWKMWFLLAAANNRLVVSAKSQDEAGEFAMEAEDASHRLIDLFPGFEPAYAEVAQAMHTLGKDEEAYNLMRYMAGKMPQSLTVHVNLALAANRAGKKDEAVQLARQIREAVGPNEELEQALSEIGA